MQRLGMLFILASAEALFSYGPAGCVHVDRSKAGTCVFRTECLKGVDLKTVELAFVCAASDGEEVEHVFEKGSLTNAESFDTDVKCAKCLPSHSEHVLVKDDSDEAEEAKEESKDEAKAESKEESKEEDKEKAKDSEDESKEESKEESKDEAKEESTEEEATEADSAEVKAAKEMVPVAPATASFYGPGSCIATFLGPAGTCVVQTACTGVEGLSGYQYGLTCVDDKGEEVRHMFGADSFDPVETFDTRIECSMCLGLAATAVPELASLKEEVAELKKDMSEVKAKLAPAEKAEEATTEETSEETTEAASETTEAASEEASLLHHAPPKIHEPPRSGKEKVEYHTHAFLKKGSAKVRHHTMPKTIERHTRRH